MNRLLKDLAIDRAKNPASALNDRWDSGEEDEEDEEGDINIVDRCKSAFLIHPFRPAHPLCPRLPLLIY